MIKKKFNKLILLLILNKTVFKVFTLGISKKIIILVFINTIITVNITVNLMRPSVNHSADVTTKVKSNVYLFRDL